MLMVKYHLGCVLRSHFILVQSFFFLNEVICVHLGPSEVELWKASWAGRLTVSHLSLWCPCSVTPELSVTLNWCCVPQCGVGGWETGISECVLK